MSQDPPSTKGSIPSQVSIRFGQVFRRYFVAGLATLFPVAVTMLLVWQIFLFTDGLLGRLLGIKIPGLGLVVTLIVILVVGVFSIHFFGRVLFRTVETWLARLPFVRKIYPAVKQLAEFLFDETGRQTAFRRVVLVQYPRLGLYSVALVTNESSTTVTGRQQTLLTLMIPTPPSPLTGPIIFLPQEEVIPLQMTVEEAFKLVLSGGVVAPSLQPAARV